MSFFDELKRRKVFRAAIAYVVGAWVLAQVADLVTDNFNAPDWVMQMIIAVLVVSFPVSLILAWVFDLTPHGLVRARDDETSQPALSDMQTYGVLGGMFASAVIILYLIWPQTSPVVPVALDNSIAVLPFANDSIAEEDAEFFSVGMHDELLARLADISTLKVISRTSVMAYRDTTKNMRQIGEELGVVYLLEGRVQRAGDRLRIIIQLIDSTSDVHVWQDTYDRELTVENIFELQAEMATSIATELRQTLSPAMTARLNEQPTQNTRAYEFYLSGDQYLKRRQAEVAARQFERAIEEDPGFALAWAALSRAHTEIFWFEIGPDYLEHLEKAREAAATAFELVPDLPEAHFAMGNYYMYGTREHEKSLAELAIAARGMPGSSDVQETIADVQGRIGDVEASIATTARAIELDPRNVRLLLQQAESYAHARDGVQFHRYLDRVLEIEPDNIAAPGLRLHFGLMLGDDLAMLRQRARSEDSTRYLDFAWVRDHWMLGIFERDYDAVLRFLDELPEGALHPVLRAQGYGNVHRLNGRPDLAKPYFEAVKQPLAQRAADSARPWGRSRQLAQLAFVTAGLGEYEEAVRISEEALAMRFPDEASITKFIGLSAAIGVFIPSGDYERAIELLDEQLATPVGWTIEGLLNDPRIDPIRDHEGWLALVDKYARR